jgi:hypothetical protein
MSALRVNYVCMYVWMDGWMDGCMYVWMDGWMDRYRPVTITYPDEMYRVIIYFETNRSNQLFVACNNRQSPKVGSRQLHCQNDSRI